jgi:FtsP/CotA-like multicopper oxidase with cupredoxin domain
MVTYQSAFILNNALQAILLLAWIAAVICTGNLARRNTVKGLRRLSRWSFGPIGAIILLSLARLFLIFQMGGNGFETVPSPVLWSLALVLPPLAATVVMVMPRLWNLARLKLGPANPARLEIDREPVSSRLEVDENTRAVAGEPALAVPVQAGAFSALLAVLVVLAPPSVLFAGICLLLFGAFVGWRWLWQTRLAKNIRQEGRSALLPLWQRLAWTGGFLLALVAALALWIVLAPQTSLLPEQYSMMGNDAQGMQMSPGMNMKMLSVTDLSGPKDATPDRRFTLVAQKARLKLQSGAVVEAWTFNGQIPGPELRVRQGELVEVTLENRDIEEGVTVHWHGVDVPNAEDGVAGLTQDAVRPGQRFVYRFRVKDSGTYWYHSHQASSEEVGRGLFGAFIVDPAESANNPPAQDLTILAHSWHTSQGDIMAFGPADGQQGRAVAPGAPVRLRLINTTNKAQAFSLTGTPFQVAAIDGVDLSGPTNLEQVRLTLAAGGRYDLRFTMPDHPVLLNTQNTGLLLSRDGKGEVSPAKTLTDFNPAGYGAPAATPFGQASHFDREYTYDLESGLGFYDGKFEPVWLINGETFPNTPSLMVREGDLVKITFVNRTVQDHPMHPHGHKMLVLKRNGQPVTGSPWWTDTLNVAPGEVYEVALKADNPGLWMDHCHDLDHAAAGMVMHLMYEDVTTPFLVGKATPNHPE